MIKLRKRKLQEMENHTPIRDRVIKKRNIAPKDFSEFRFTYTKPHTKILIPSLIIDVPTIEFLEPEDSCSIRLQHLKPNSDNIRIPDQELESFAATVIEKLKKEREKLKVVEENKKKDRNKIVAFQDKAERYQKAFELYDKRYTQKYLVELFSLNYGTWRYLQSKRNKGLPILKKKAERPTKILQRHLDFVETYLLNPRRCITSLREIKNNLCRHLNIDSKEISLQTIAKMIKRVGFSKKRVRKYTITRNFIDRKKQRYQNSKSILSALYQGKNLIFIDESSFNQNLLPIFGYSAIDKRFFIFCPNHVRFLL